MEAFTQFSLGVFFLCLGAMCLMYGTARLYDVGKSWEQVDEDDEVTYE